MTTQHFTSQTLSDAQLLCGPDAHAPEVLLSGQWRAPSSALTPVQADQPLPVVVLVHGSNGVGAREQGWSEVLNAHGLATFTLDCFSGRGIRSTATDQAQLGRLAMVLDIYRAIAHLARQPQVDARRVVVMGFSRGGQAALYSALQRLRRLHARGPQGAPLTMAATLAFYPDCSTTYLDDEAMAPEPIRVHHGEADDYNPLAPCAAYVQRLAAAGADIALHSYPDAHHVFDTPVGDGPTGSPQAQSMRQCRWREVAPGQIVHAQDGQPFSYAHPCVVRGTTSGAHPAARAAAQRAVLDFLTPLLGLAG